MTKFLDFAALDGMGFEVDMLGVTSVVNTIQIVTANDAPERDPTTYEISGSIDGTTYTSIVIGEIPSVAERFLPRYFGFPKTISYFFYRVNFTDLCGTSDIMQVADVQLFPIIGNAPTIAGLTICEFEVTVDDEVSIEDQILSNGISISPNPTHNIMTIYNESNIDLENAIIYDLHGKMIHSVNFKPAEKYHSFDLTNWNSGMYLIRIKGAKGVAAKKLIKL